MTYPCFLEWVALGVCHNLHSVALSFSAHLGQQPPHITDGESDVLPAMRGIAGYRHDVIKVDYTFVINFVQRMDNLVHIHVAVIQKDFGIALRRRKRASHVAEVDVLDFVLAAEVADALEDVFA